MRISAYSLLMMIWKFWIVVWGMGIGMSASEASLPAYGYLAEAYRPAALFQPCRTWMATDYRAVIDGLNRSTPAWVRIRNRLENPPAPSASEAAQLRTQLENGADQVHSWKRDVSEIIYEMVRFRGPNECSMQQIVQMQRPLDDLEDRLLRVQRELIDASLLLL